LRQPLEFYFWNEQEDREIDNALEAIYAALVDS
jgi:hypothetical protein